MHGAPDVSESCNVQILLDMDLSRKLDFRFCISIITLTLKFNQGH